LTLTAWYAASLLLIVLVTGVAAYLIFAHAERSEIDNSLRSGAASLAGQLSEGVAGFDSSEPAPGAASIEDDDVAGSDVLRFLSGDGSDTFYAILAADGKPLLNPLNARLSEFPPNGAVEEAIAKGSAWRTVDSGHGDYRLFFMPVRREAQLVAVIEVGRSLEERGNHLRTLAIVLAATSGAGLLLAAGGGLYLAGRALAPVRTAFERQRSFVADASHELRSPLTLLRASAEAVQRSSGPNLSGADQEALADILVESDRMALLVDDLLILTRLDEGQLALRRELIDLPALLQEAQRWALVAASGRRLEITSKSPDGLSVYADREHLLRVLRILLDNAVRHTPDGGRINLDASKSHDGVDISVSDTGSGIDSEAQARIFDRFYRVDSARTHSATSGTGLGLSIAKGLVEAHGGQIRVVSALDRGSTFSFSLPAAN
jgi:signal transduction histidine kinase